VLASVFGLLTFATAVGFLFLPDVTAARDCHAAEIVLDFEFARTAADLDRAFGPLGDDCRMPRAEALEAINRLDAAAFIPAYTLFGVFAAIFLTGGLFRALTFAALASSLTALAADYVETLVLLDVTPTLALKAGELELSSTAAWIKFGALAAHGMVLAGICLWRAPRRPILAALLTLPLVGLLAAAAGQSAVLTPAIGFAWGALWAMSLRAAVRGR
jgi:hypothetical protein